MADLLTHNVKAMISQLKDENRSRQVALNDRDCSDYLRTVLHHKFNNTNDIIKRMEQMLENSTL